MLLTSCSGLREFGCVADRRDMCSSLNKKRTIHRRSDSAMTTIRMYEGRLVGKAGKVRRTPHRIWVRRKGLHHVGSHLFCLHKGETLA